MTKLKLLCASVACVAWHVACAYIYPVETIDGKNWSYFPMLGGVEIQKAPVSLSGSVDVPEKLGGQPVIGIRPQAFQGCSDITSVTLPDTVREIGDYAFSGLSGLEYVYFPWGLESIGEKAFYGTGLATIHLPGTLTYVGAYAFQDCVSLSKAVLGAGVTHISDGMFKGCTSLNYMELPKSLETVGVRPFDGASVIVGDNAYAQFWLEGVEGGGSLASYGILGRIQAQQPDIEFISRIGATAWAVDPPLGKVSVWIQPGSTVSVLFGDKKVVFPYGAIAGPYLQENGLATNIWRDVYTGREFAPDTIVTDKFESRSMSSNPREPGTIDVGSATLKYIAHEKSVEIVGHEGSLPTTLAIPSEIGGLPVKAIGDKAFTGCGSLEYIYLPWGLETIGKQAFSACSGLWKMVIPGTVRDMGEDTFSNCTNLRSMVIGYGVTSTPPYFMYNATNLKDIEIPKTLASIGECFCYCDNNGGGDLTIWCERDAEIAEHDDNVDRIEAVFAENNPDLTGRDAKRNVFYKYQPRIASQVSFDDVTVTNEYGKCLALNLPDYPSNSLFIGWFAGNGSEADEDTVPFLLGGYTARYNDGPLPTETIEDALGREYTWTYAPHGDYAEVRGVSASSFGDTLSIPATLGGLPVKVIGPAALAGKARLGGIIIPEGVTAIRERAFSNIVNLHYIVMPSTLRHIGKAAFYGCSGLHSVEIPDGVLSIGSEAFSNCDITDATLPGTLRYAGEYIFANNPRLERCTLLDGIEEVPSRLIFYCDDFKFISIPKSVKRVGQQAFYFGKDLSKVLCDVVLDGSGRESKAEVNRVKAMVNEMFDGFTGITQSERRELNSRFEVVSYKGFDITCRFTSADFKSSVEKSVKIGTNLGLAIPDPPEKEGYTFLGWVKYLSRDNGVSPFLPVTTPIEYVARYGAQECRVVFRMEGVDAADVTNYFRYGSSVGILPRIASRSGYSFGGWFTVPNGGGSQVTPDTVVTGDVNFYPKWIQNTSIFRLVFDASEGEGSYELFRQSGSAIGEGMRIPTKTGYTFLGWYSETLDGYVTPETCVYDNAEYTAKWQVNTYTVQFSDDSWNSFKNNVRYGDPLGTLPSRPNEGGWEFVGWYSSSGVLATEDTPVLGNETYYARWKALGVVLTFDYNTPSGQTYKHIVTPPYMLTGYDVSPISRTGYTFLGWFTAREGGEEVQAGKRITRETTYYAHWQLNSHHVTLNLNNSRSNPVFAEADYDYGEAISLLDRVPEREGVDFLGWYTEDGVRVNGSVTLPDADVTYYAHWKEYYKCEYVGGDVGMEIVNRNGGSAWIGGDVPERLEIPSVLDGYTVASIGRGAFMNCAGLREVVIPDTVTRIGMWAFAGCADLGSITIPTSVKYIDEGAFNRTSITNVCVEFGYADYYRELIKDSGYDVSSIEFHETGKPGIYNLMVTINNFGMLCEIDGYDAKLVSVYYVPGGTSSMEIPVDFADGTLPCRYKITTIGSGAFNGFGASGLDSITIHSCVTNIEAGAFTALFGHSVTVNVDAGDRDRVSSLLLGSGHDLTNVTVVQPPETFKVTFDANGGYFDWSARPFYTWDAYVQEGGQIGSLIESLYEEPVCKGMKFNYWYVDPYTREEVAGDFVPTEDTTVYADWSPVLNWSRYPDSSYTSVTIRGVSTEVGELPSEIEVPDMMDEKPVKAIAPYTFYGNTDLVRITLPASIEEVQDESFEDCTALGSIAFPATVTGVGYNAFKGCTALESVAFEPGVGGRKVWQYAFCGCTNLVSVEIPDDVDVSPDGVFKGCTKLADENGFVVFRGVLYDYVGEATQVVIPDDVTVIGEGAFERRTDIQSVEFPAALKSIRASAFFGCTGLGSVEIPDGVVEIGDLAFAETQIQTIEIPDSVSSVGYGAFPETAVDMDIALSRRIALVDGWVIGVDPDAFSNAESVDLTGVRGISVDMFGNNASPKEIKFSKDIMHLGARAFPVSLEIVRVPRGEQSRITRLICEADPDVGNHIVVVEDVPPSIIGDKDAVVVANESGVGYDVYPSATDRPIDIAIPGDCDPADVNVNVPATSGKVKPNGANIRVTNEGVDITRHLDMPAADGDGYVDINAAAVKQEVADEAIDKDNLSLDPEDPQMPVNTVPGLVYTFNEGTSLEDLSPTARKVGDGSKWNPEVTVKGGTSGFYSISVDKK